MDLSKEQREKVTIGVQALIILLALVLTVKEDAKGRSAHLKKMLEKEAKRTGKLEKQKYKIEKAGLTKKYKDLMKAQKKLDQHK